MSKYANDIYEKITILDPEYGNIVSPEDFKIEMEDDDTRGKMFKWLSNKDDKFNDTAEDFDINIVSKKDEPEQKEEEIKKDPPKIKDILKRLNAGFKLSEIDLEVLKENGYDYIIPVDNENRNMIMQANLKPGLTFEYLSSELEKNKEYYQNKVNENLETDEDFEDDGSVIGINKNDLNAFSAWILGQGEEMIAEDGWDAQTQNAVKWSAGLNINRTQLLIEAEETGDYSKLAQYGLSEDDNPIYENGQVVEQQPMIFKDGKFVGGLEQGKDLDLFRELMVTNDPRELLYSYGKDRFLQQLNITPEEWDEQMGDAHKMYGSYDEEGEFHEGLVSQKGKQQLKEFLFNKIASEEFDGIRDFFTIEGGIKANEDDYNKIFNNLPEFESVKTPNPWAQNTGAWGDVSLRNSSFQSAAKGLNLFQTLELERLYNNEKYIKAKQIQYDNLTDVMETTLPEDFNQWTATKMLDDIAKATSKEKKEYYTKVYLTYVEEKGGYEFASNKGALLYDPNTGNYIRRKEATEEEKAKFSTYEDYVQGQIDDGSIPNDKNTQLRDMLNLQYQMVYLAKQLTSDVPGLIKNQGFWGTVREGFSGGRFVNGDFAPSELDNLNQIVKNGKLVKGFEKIENINSPLVRQWNQNVMKFNTLSHAYLMNFDPATLDKSGFQEGFLSGGAEYLGGKYMSQDDMAQITTKYLQDKGIEFTSDELNNIYTPAFWNEVGQGTPGFLAMMGEFAITRKLGGSSIKALSNGLMKLPGMIFGESNFIRNVSKYGNAALSSTFEIYGRNYLAENLTGGDYIDPRWGVFGGPGGRLVDDMYKIKYNIKNPVFIRLVEGWNKAPFLTNTMSYPIKQATKAYGGAASMWAGDAGLLQMEYLSGDINHEEYMDRWDELTDWRNFNKTAAQMFVVQGATPYKIIKETWEGFNKDLIKMTGNHKYLQENSSKLDADWNYLGDKNVTSDMRENRIDEATDRRILKIDGMNRNVYDKLKNQFNVIKKYSPFKWNSLKPEDLTLENFDAGYKRLLETTFKNREVPKDFQQAYNQIKFALESGVGGKFLESNEVYRAADKLKFQNSINDIKNTIKEDKHGAQMLADVSRFVARRSDPNGQGVGYDAVDIEVMGNMPKTILEGLLSEANLSKEVISRQGGYIELARDIVNSRNFYNFKSGTRNSNKFMESMLKEFEMKAQLYKLKTKKVKFGGKEISDLGKKDLKLIEDLETDIVTEQSRQEKLIEKQDVLTEKERQKNIELGVKEGKAIVAETEVDFWKQVEERYESGEMSKAEYDRLKTTQELSESTKIEIEEIDSKLAQLESGKDLMTKERYEELKKEYEDLKTDILQKDKTFVKGAAITLDGKAATLINVEAMRTLRDVTATQHENLHHYFNQAIRKLELAGNKFKKDEFISGFKELLSDREYQTVLKRVERHPDYQKGDINTLEWLNIYADALIKGELDYRPSTLSKIGKALESFWKKETPAEELIIDSPQKALDALLIYRKGVESNKVSDQVAKAILGEEGVGLSLSAEKSLENSYQDLINQRAKLNSDFASKVKDQNYNITQDERKDYHFKKEALNKFINNIEKNLDISASNQEYIAIIKDPNVDRAAKEKAENKLVENNMGIIQKMINKYKPIKDSRITKEDWEGEVYYEFAKAIETYDGNSPFGAYIARFLPKKEGNMWRRLKKGMPESDFLRTEFDEATLREIPTSGGMVREVDAPSVGIHMAEALDVPPKIVDKWTKQVYEVAEKIDFENLNYKDFGKEMTEEGVALSKSIAKEFKELAGKNNAERRAYLTAHWETFYNMIPKTNMALTPEGEPITGKSIGIPNSLLKILFTEKGRVKYTKQEKGAGLAIQEKIEGLDQAKFIDLFFPEGEGVTPKDKRNALTAFDALLDQAGNYQANVIIRGEFNNPKLQKLMESKNPELAKKMKIDSYLANIEYQLAAGKSPTMLSAEKKMQDDLSTSLRGIEKGKYENIEEIAKLIKSYQIAEDAGGKIAAKWHEDHPFESLAIEEALKPEALKIAEIAKLEETTKSIKEDFPKMFEEEIIRVDDKGKEYKVTSSDLQKEVDKLSTIWGVKTIKEKEATKDIPAGKYKVVDVKALLNFQEGLREYSKYLGKDIPRTLLNSLLTEVRSTTGAGYGVRDRGDLLAKITNEKGEVEYVPMNEYLQTTIQKFGTENQGSLAGTQWEGVRQSGYDLKKYKKAGEIAFSGKPIEEIQTELSKIFNKEDFKDRRKFYDAIIKSKEQYLEGATSKEDYLKRVGVLMQIAKHNTNVELGERQFISGIEGIHIPKEKIDLTKDRFKLEHMFPSLAMSIQSTAAAIRGNWMEEGPQLQDRYKGVYGSEAKLKELDKLGGNTNTSKWRGAFTPELFSNIWTPASGFKRTLQQDIIANTWKKIKAEGYGLSKENFEILKNKPWFNPSIQLAGAELRLGEPTSLTFKQIEMFAKNVKNYELLHGDNSFHLDKGLKNVLGKDVMKFKDERIGKQVSIDNQVKIASVVDGAFTKGLLLDQPVKKGRVFDFDDTIARTKSRIIVEDANGKFVKHLTPEEFAKFGSTYQEMGMHFNFKEFNEVKEGKKGPLADVAKKIYDAGTSDLFILTARAPEAAPAIHQFMKEGLGIDISLETITEGCLGSSHESDKGLFMVDLYNKGYNDLFFADDHVGNIEAVKNVFEQLDVKGKVQLAKKSEGQLSAEVLSDEFNIMLQQKTGIEWYKKYSPEQARIQARKRKWRNKRIFAHSQKDFEGLNYVWLPKGKKGEAAQEWLREKLYAPYGEAINNLSKDRIQLITDYKALKTQLPVNLKKKGVNNFSKESLIRMYAWHQQGMEIPGVSKKDIAAMNKYIQANPELQLFAEKLIEINKGDGYAMPGKNWGVGTIQSDLMIGLQTVKRKKYLQVWQQNVDAIYNATNLEKLRYKWGDNYVEALENSLYRMKTGSNRREGTGRIENEILDYINNSTGAIMFLNVRSAALQTISAINYMNWHDNSPIKAGAAFANQPQYWKDFTTLWNSDYLKDRKLSSTTDISMGELASAVEGQPNKAKAALNYLQDKGYVLTKSADAYAIASGGATFYRNRIKSLMKNDPTMKLEEAERLAYNDWVEISNINQQSARADKISQQQAGGLGRLILAFGNTPAQYARIMRKSSQDLIHGRGDPKEHISKILYYGAAQNLIFNAAQQAMFSLMFEEETDEAKASKIKDVGMGMFSSVARGFGIGGVTVETVVKMVDKYWEESEKDRPDYAKAAYELLNLSPTIKSKFQGLVGAGHEQTYKDETVEYGIFDPDNPNLNSVLGVIQSVTNLPTKNSLKLYNAAYKIGINTIGDEASAMDNWKLVALAMGYPEWQLESSHDKAVKKEEKNIRKKKASPQLYHAEEQKDILKQYGWSNEEINNLSSEKERVEAIQKLEKEKGKQYTPRKEVNEIIKLKKTNKADQEKMLIDLGVKEDELKNYKTEDARVKAIIKLKKEKEKKKSYKPSSLVSP